MALVELPTELLGLLVEAVLSLVFATVKESMEAGAPDAM
jgi:hypothetical protein